jgi:hypothetical protein
VFVAVVPVVILSHLLLFVSPVIPSAAKDPEAFRSPQPIDPFSPYPLRGRSRLHAAKSHRDTRVFIDSYRITTQVFTMSLREIQ